MFIARAGQDMAAGAPVALIARPRTLTSILVLMAAALLLRAPAFIAAVTDPDEGLYVVQAASWLRGQWPYIWVWDMHPPGAPALLALAQAVVADPVLAARLAGCLAVGATACLLRALALRLGAEPATALVAGLLYVAHSLLNGGLATNTELLFAPFVVLAALLLLGEVQHAGPPRSLLVLAAGLSAGMALWVKQVTALESSALWLTMVVVALAQGRLRWPRLFGLAGLFALGAGAPTLGVAAGYWASGHFADWLQGNILAPLAYVGAKDEAPGLRLGLALGLPPLSALLLACCGLRFADATARRAARLLLPWLAAAVLAVGAPGKYYDHYFLILVPPLSLLAAFGLTAAIRFAVRQEVQRGAFAVAVALMVGIPTVAMLQPRLAHGLGLRGADPVRQVARLAAAELGPSDTLFVANWHTVTYALAGKAPPTRFAFPMHLSGTEPELAGTDIQAELERVLALPPKVIVLDPNRWGLIRDEARRAIEAAVARDYELAGVVSDGGRPVEVWRRR